MASHSADVNADVLMERMRKVFRSGVTRPLSWRKDQLRKLALMVQEREEEFCEALAADLHRRVGDGAGEVLPIKNEAEKAIKNLDLWCKPTKVATDPICKPAHSELVPEPYGVVLIIGPWNFPIILCLEPLIGAIAAGNAVVLKPSEVSPACSAVLAKCLAQYLDSDAIRVVQGGPSVAVSLLEQKWDKILFTGGTEVGRKVALAAAKHLTPVTLELGGRNPVYLDDSADMEIACKRLVWGMNTNAGQICLKPEYILVHKSLVDKLVATLKKIIPQFYGEDPSQSRDICRIISDRHLSRLLSFLEDPRVKERIVAGGTADKETRYMAPTLLVDVPWDCQVMQEETFGPIMAVQPVESLDEAISVINDRPKPLALYVFSTRTQVIDRVINETSSGGVLTNDTIMHVLNFNLPFGGVGDSGMGVYKGKASFDCFTHEKPVMKKNYAGDSPMRYPPTDATRDKIMRALVMGDMWGLLMLILGFRK